MNRTRLAVGLVTAAVSLSLLAACSDPSHDATDEVGQGRAEDFRAEQARQADVERAYAALPSRPSGVVDIDGSTDDSLTRSEVVDYRATTNAAEVNVGDNGEDRAYQELCAGQVDLVDAARPISRAEWEACQAVGLDVVQFGVAAEAIVIAIKSETDVGADCLSVDQVRDLYRAGSPLTNWSQEPLGYDDVPLEVGGPSPENNGFGFFGRYVLDAPEPSRVDLRSDYVLAVDDEAARHFVVGMPWMQVKAARFDDAARIRAQADQSLQDARDEMLAARDELATALAERAKGIRDQRSGADKRKDQRRVDRAYARRSAARIRLDAAVARYGRIGDRYVDISHARDLYNRYRGHVAYFRYGYYELFEDQLRPFEITRPGDRMNCIFPSQRTITSGEYPLARQLLITTTTRSLARTEVRALMSHYLRTAEDRALEARLVALPHETLDLELAWLSGEKAPQLYAPTDDSAGPTRLLQREKPAR